MQEKDEPIGRSGVYPKEILRSERRTRSRSLFNINIDNNYLHVHLMISLYSINVEDLISLPF